MTEKRDVATNSPIGLSIMDLSMSDALRRYVTAGTGYGRHHGEDDAERTARLRRGDPSPGLVLSQVGQVTGAMINEAKALMPSVDGIMAPLPRHELAREIRNLATTLAMSVRNPPTGKARELREAAMVLACEGYPASAWGRPLLAEAARRFEFWPSAAEVARLVSEMAKPTREMAAKVRVVAAKKIAPEETWVPPTDEEKAQVAAKMDEIRSKLSARREADERVAQFGQWVAPGSGGLTGRPLAAHLAALLPTMEGALRNVTAERIKTLNDAADLADQIESEESEKQK